MNAVATYLTRDSNVLDIAEDNEGLYCIFFLGLSPTESFDEAIADMIADGVEDVVAAIIKAFMEKDEVKQVNMVNFVIFFCYLIQAYSAERIVKITLFVNHEMIYQPCTQPLIHLSFVSSIIILNKNMTTDTLLQIKSKNTK